MVLFKDLQTHATALIAAHAFFTGQTVLEDRGNKEKEIEEALRTIGQAVAVPLILDGVTSTGAQGGGTAILDCGLAVLLKQNPKKASLDIYEMMVAVKAALLGYNSRNPNDVYRMSDKAFIVDDTDPGAITYHLFFDKRVAF